MNHEKNLIPAALYARVSSDRQDVDLSVAAQLRALRDYAEKNGYSVAREYVDEAESGRIADRPQFRKMLEDSPIGGRDAEEVALHGPVLSIVKSGGPDWTKSRTEADSDVTPSDGMGIVYVRTASSSTISMPCTKLRMRAFRSGKVPSRNNSRKSATYPLISFEVGNSARRCSNWALGPLPRRRTSWSCRALQGQGCGATAPR